MTTPPTTARRQSPPNPRKSPVRGTGEGQGLLFDEPRPCAMQTSAVLSPCENYRYTLTRIWDDQLPGVLFIMLNPSTADASADDPTIRRCLGYARAWGCGSVTVVNLFAFRATDPAILRTGNAAAFVGPDNDRHIREQVALHRGAGDYIVAAWGVDAAHKKLRGRRNDVLCFLPLAELYCLATTKGGDPRHPLYCRADLGPVTLETGPIFAQGRC